ncbi:MAG: hypothetical protein ACYCS1_06230, partial [Gammaproteobacteria bacterium]
RVGLHYNVFYPRAATAPPPTKALRRFILNMTWKTYSNPLSRVKCPAEGFTPDAFDFRPHHAALFALGP